MRDSWRLSASTVAQGESCLVRLTAAIIKDGDWFVV
jgi:hypothetical protein